MSFAIGVLAHNVYRYGRAGVFKRTLASLAVMAKDHEVQVFVVSNGSDDGTEDMVRKMGGTVVDDPVSTSGHGMNVTLGICVASGAEHVVFSNDDVGWHPDALERLEAWWAEAPADLVLVSGLLEDDFPWNTVRARVDYGGQAALVRDNAPAAAWSFRARDWPVIAPIPEAPGWDDVPVCRRLRERGYRVAQLDLAEHLGAGASTWGNASAPFGKPLDREAWGLPAR